MAFQQRTRPYETLIRHNADGSIGSHHQQIQEGYDDVTQQVYFANIQPPQSLSSAGLEGVLGQAFVQATEQISAQAAQITGLTTTLAARDATVTAQAGVIESQAAQIVALQAQVAALTPPPEEPSAQAPEEPLV